MPPIEPAKVRPGNKLVVDGDIYEVIEFAHTKPGKGQAFVKCKIKNLQNGRVLEKTWKIGEMLETADFQKHTCQFLYSDPDGYNFMDLGSYEQFFLPEDMLGYGAKFLQPDAEVIVSFWEGRPIGVELPPKAVFEVTDTVEAVKGNTANAITKDATIETGHVLQVPPFIKIGEKIVVSTETGEYVERA
ncbi:elongation factor P [bacterium]|nr:elongation factor P [bacterium]